MSFYFWSNGSEWRREPNRTTGNKESSLSGVRPPPSQSPSAFTVFVVTTNPVHDFRRRIDSSVQQEQNRSQARTVHAHTMCGIIAGAFVSFLLPTGTGPVRSVSGSNLPNRCGIKKNEFELKNEKFQKKIPKIFQVTTSLTVSKKIQISVRLV